MSDISNTPDPDRIDQEHDHLIAMITELRSWQADVSELGMPRFGEMSTRLQLLAERLDEHFSHEEALRRATSCAADEIDVIVDEHQAIRNECEALIRRLHDSETPFSSWQAACEEFEALCARLARHEQHEIELQKSAVNGSRSATES